MEEKEQQVRRVSWAAVVGCAGICFTFLVQLVATVWLGATFMATTNTKLDVLSDSMKSLTASAYTQDSARKDMLRMEEHQTDLERRIGRLEGVNDRLPR